MKQQLRYYLLLSALMLCISSFADTSKLTFTEKCGGKGTADNGVEWIVKSDAQEKKIDSDRGIHYGTNAAPPTYLTLTTSGIVGQISKITVCAAGNKGVDAVLSVSVGNEKFGENQNVTSNKAADFTFEGSGNGTIEVKLTQTTKSALYVKSIEVEYSGSPVKTFVVNSIADLCRVENDAEVTLKLSAEAMARVTYVHGEDATQEAFVRDNTGAVCFYGIRPNVPFKHGQHLAGQITGRYTSDNGLPKLCAIDGKTNTAYLVIAQPVNEPQVTPNEIAAEAYDNHAADWVRIRSLHIADDQLTTREGIALNTSFAPSALADGHKLYKNAIVDIAGIAIPANTTKQLCPIEIGNERAVVFVVDENEDYTSPQTDFANVAVRLNRTLKADAWNTFCVPFDMELPEDATATRFTGKVTEDGRSLVFAPADKIEAGVPYLIKGELTNTIWDNVTLKSTPAQSVKADKEGYAFIGTYGRREMKTDKSERFLSKDQTLCWPEDNGNPDYKLLKGMRAYYVVPTDVQAAKVMFQGEATGIAPIVSISQAEDVKIYNLNGQLMNGSLNDLPKGIYIINGHKIIKK